MISQLLTVAPTDLDLTRLAVLAALAWLGWRLVLVVLFPFAL